MIEHNHKFRVGKHCACLYGIEQIFHILRNGGRVAVSLSELPPSRVKENAALLVLKYNMKLVDKHMGTLALFPVERNTVENRIEMCIRDRIKATFFLSIFEPSFRAICDFYKEQHYRHFG